MICTWERAGVFGLVFRKLDLIIRVKILNKKILERCVIKALISIINTFHFYPLFNDYDEFTIFMRSVYNKYSPKWHCVKSGSDSL